MRRDGQPVGVLSIQSYTPNAYSQEDLRTLQALADYCAGALERIRAEQALQQREELNRAILATAMDGFFALDFAADPAGRNRRGQRGLLSPDRLQPRGAAPDADGRPRG